MDVKIGYPAKWRDYSTLKIDPADLYGNVEREHRVRMAAVSIRQDREGRSTRRSGA